MKKLSKVLLGVLCVGTLAGCGNKTDRTGSVIEAFKSMEDLTSATINMNLDMKVPSMAMLNTSYSIVMKVDEDGDLYTEMTMMDETYKSYTINRDGETCEIEYYNEDEMDKAGWYGTCSETVEGEEEEIPFDTSALESYTDEDFVYGDGWYVLSEEKTNEIAASLVENDLGGYGSLINMSTMEDLTFKVQLANDKVESIKMSFSITQEGTKMNYTFTIKLSKVNKTKVSAPKFTDLNA